MRPIPAIVESEYEHAFIAVRTTYSELREADVQVEKSAKREADATRIAAAARTKAEGLRRDLGKHLLRARMAWPERGPRSKGWGEFLEREGIEQSTAWRYMEEARARSESGKDFMQPDRVHETPAGIPNSPRGSDPIARKRGPLAAAMQLRLGRWETALVDIGMVDAMITDPPYSARTHSKSRHTRADNSDTDGMGPNYDPWAQADVDAFVDAWSPRCRGWMLCLCDDEMIPWYRAAYERNGRFAFAPVPCGIRGMTVRVQGDGPSSEAVYAMVGRPRTAEFLRWGTLPGFHFGNTDHGSKHGRGKPRWLLDELVDRYSRENDLVCDPLAGYGTTLISALLKGRRAIGAEIDELAIKEAFVRADALDESLDQ